MFKLLACLLTILLVPLCLQAYQERNIFAKKLSGHTNKTLADLRTIREKIATTALTHLHGLPEEEKAKIQEIANNALKQPWHPMLAYDYLEYARNGNRDHYEHRVSEQIKHLNQLIVGQLLALEKNQTDTRFMAEIVNGLWIELEASTWVWPAHIYLQGKQHLPQPGVHVIDLESGETMKLMGWAKLLLQKQLNEMSPIIVQRIDYELRKRVFEPYLNTSLSNNWFWTGFHGHTVNNWNIWINANILKAALYTLDDEHLFDAVVNRTIHSADYFLNGYGDDGGCDEGPAYWRQAGGRLIEYLETLDHLYGVREYFRSIELLQRIGEYPSKMRIFDNWYVNFADSIPTIGLMPSLLFKYGQMFNDEMMKKFAAYVYQTSKKGPAEELADLNEFINTITVQADVKRAKPEAPTFDTFYFHDIQVATIRSKESFHDQLFVAAKAGNNHESHNHNDVGNLVLFVGKQPILIDIGVGTYTAQTFGSHRYDLFYMQSSYHNCPTINGMAQHEGGNYTSRNTSFKVVNDVASLTSDISGAYPSNASVVSWIRTITFDRANNFVQLDDVYALGEFGSPQQLHFITVKETKVVKGEHGLTLQAGDTEIAMEFDTKVLDYSIETRDLEKDKHLTQVWGDSVQRLTLTTVDNFKDKQAHLRIKFAPSKHTLFYSVV